MAIDPLWLRAAPSRRCAVSRSTMRWSRQQSTARVCCRSCATFPAAGDGDGPWLPATLAAAAEVGPADTVTLVGTADDGGAIEVTADVAGVYRAPFDDGLLRPDASDVWRDVLASVPRAEESTRVPPLLVVDRRTFLELATALDERVMARWESSLTSDATSLVGARTLVDAFRSRASDPTGAVVTTIGAFARPG